MQVKKTQESPTKVKLTVVAAEKDLLPIKKHVLGNFQDKVNVPGFRKGKIPPEVLEKHVNPESFQSEFLQEAAQQLYVGALEEVKVRPVDRPEVSLQKFVPYSNLEFEATVEVVGETTLPDYKAIKKTKPVVKITEKDVTEVIKSLQTRMAEKKDVDRAAKDGDEVWIDFEGVDAKTKEPIKGADGKDYPLIIGSNTFIPGFEPELIGLKGGSDKTFTLTFPKDYGAAALANKKVTFTVHVTKVQEVVEPKVDDEFAAKVGPFKTVAELKSDIKKQLKAEKQQQADRDFESELVKEISEKSEVAIPETLINDQVERLLSELRQNLTYRGQTMQEFLESEGKTEEQYRKEVLKPQAQERVKASLMLAEVAEQEKLTVTPEELDKALEDYRQQYSDEKMQAELDKPEARRDIAARLLTQKTIEKLTSYATK